ncbi:MAG: type II toxin-antitoxin system HicB family antitoxin [Chloroflexi bacterium]|nr:type II toxin-antitoxin system HicB family antitoxin [Chloroflexota bacterium]
MAEEYEYTVVLEYDDEIGEYAALVPSLPGCHSQGRTREEALANVQQAIRGHIEALRQLGCEIPVEARVRVAV